MHGIVWKFKEIWEFVSCQYLLNGSVYYFDFLDVDRYHFKRISTAYYCAILEKFAKIVLGYQIQVFYI